MEANFGSPGHGRPKGKEKHERCCQRLHYHVPYIGQGSFGVAYASLGKSASWPCLVGRGVRDPRFTRFLDIFIMPSSCGVPLFIVSSAKRSNLSVVWVVDRLHASCVKLSSRTPLHCPPLVAVAPKSDLVAAWWTLVMPMSRVCRSTGFDHVRALMLDRAFRCEKSLKKLVVGPRGESAGLPHGEHQSARPYCRRCSPGLNWPGRSSGAVTLKKVECSKQAYTCKH
ncbi:hypothetical protein V6N13_116640 [Hibiscus sabdariffa]